jgi:glycosyltransferase involved in cell wall biosynthesis
LNRQYLDDSWLIVVVAASGEIDPLRSTLDCVARQSLGSNVLVLAGEHPDLREYLDTTDYSASYSLPLMIEEGNYWSAVLSAMDFGSTKNLFLQAGASVPQHWDARLVAAGQRVPEAWAIAPLCAKHPILSAFFDSSHKPGLSVDDVDQWLNDYVEGSEFVVPTLLESCLFIQGDVWPELASCPDDASLFNELRNTGKWLLATDQLYVDDSAVAYEASLDAQPQAYQNAYGGRHPLTATRHALMELSARHEKPPLVRDCLPVQLHIGHSWGGGLGRWMEDFIAADSRHNHLVLRSVGDLSAFGQVVSLHHSTEMSVPLRRWVLSEPIMSTTLTNYEYARIIEEIVRDYCVESLMVSSLIGQSMDLLRTDLATTYVLHDFFPFCPALYATFDSPCLSCTPSDMSVCARTNPLNSFFKLESDEHWRAVREGFINFITQERIVAVAPTASVAQRYRRLEPRLADKTINIIGHGLDAELANSLRPASEERVIEQDRRLRIVVLGRISPEKGGQLLSQMIEQVAEVADIWLLGAGDSGAQFSGVANTHIIWEYQKMELGDYLRQIDADLGLMLSVVPETFSYTLSELWAAGVPVLATRLGAFEDRVVEGVNGWLVDPSAAIILDRVRLIDADRAGLASVRSTVHRQSIRLSTDMVADYASIESTPEKIPLRRYFLPRRSHQNAYKNPEPKKQALFIDEQVTYRTVLLEFLAYSRAKMEQSPKLPKWLSRIGQSFLAWLGRRLSRKQAIDLEAK